MQVFARLVNLDNIFFPRLHNKQKDGEKAENAVGKTARLPERGSLTRLDFPPQEFLFGEKIFPHSEFLTSPWLPMTAHNSVLLPSSLSLSAFFSLSVCLSYETKNSIDNSRIRACRAMILIYLEKADHL